MPLGIYLSFFPDASMFDHPDVEKLRGDVFYMLFCNSLSVFISNLMSISKKSIDFHELLQKV